MSTLALKQEEIKIFLERAKERHEDKEIQEEILNKLPDILTATTIVLRSLIRKKKTNYYFIKRFIDDVIYNKEKEGFSLKVISNPLL